jgi:hypothetical protein
MKPVDNQRIAQLHIRSYWQRAAAVIAIAVGLSILSVSSLLAGPGNPGVFRPDSHPYGATYGEWGARWWQWSYSIPLHVNTSANDPTGAQCGINQSGPVWFLAGTTGGPATRNCTIPARMAIFFPIIDAINDYPCPEPPPFEPAPGQSVEDFLTEGAHLFIDPVNSLQVEVDGTSLTNLFDSRATSKLFGFTGASDLTPIDSCVTGSPQLGVADGYWIMLRPLSVGNHTLHFRGASPAFSNEVTYHLSIVHGK